LSVCIKAKRQYEKSHRESEKALDAYRKSDADIHLSRADVEKVSTESLLFRYFAWMKYKGLKHYIILFSHSLWILETH